MAFSQLKADFEADILNGCSPLVVQFKDLSSGNPTSWAWDLGNGIISTQKNPGAIYINPGPYTIKLKVKDAAGNEDSTTKSGYINVYSSPLVEFNATPSAGCLPLTVSFQDQSTTLNGNIQSWLWDFGDGTSNTVQNPVHTYINSDTFSISLTVTTNFGCTQSLLKTAYVAVSDTVHSDFDYTYTTVCSAPASFSFVNRSKGRELSYQWNFGDGGQSTLTNPSHNYTTNGNYDVTLITMNKSGCADTLTKKISIGTNSVNFTLPSNICVNEPAIMRDSSIPAAISGAWNFGDGSKKTGLVVSHVYKNAGTYEITYTANFGGCIDSIKKTLIIAPKPQASFSSPSIRASCFPPLTVEFTNTSTGADTYIWDFGDKTTSTEINPTHTYDTSGEFTVKLIAISSSVSCADTVAMTAFVRIGQPEIIGFQNFPIFECPEKNIPFVATIISPDSVTSYTWDFGDGNTSTAASPTHSYTSPGSYTVKLLVKTSSGCTDSFSLADAVVINEKPTANFKANPLNTCASTPIQFTDLSTGTITDWKWTFGDGSQSTEQNPTHKYADTGYFNVVLVVSNNGCNDSILFKNYIHISPPIAEFESAVDCSKRFFRSFTDRSLGAQSWRWNFGDGVTSNVQNPQHTYSGIGTYDVTLIVKNETCSDTVTHTVYALNENPSIKITAAHSNFCKGDSINFSAININPEYIRNYFWNFGDGQSASGAGYNPAGHRYTQAGKYTPFLITTDLNGCFDTAQTSTTTTIYGPTASFGNPPGTCINNAILFTDSSVTDGVHPLEKWEWDFGDGNSTTVTSKSVSHNYSNTGGFPVQMIVHDSNGCTDTLLKRNAVIITNPSADFSLLDSVRCTASPVFFLNHSTGLTLSYSWKFGDGDTSKDSDPSHLYASQGIYSVTLKIKDRYGCTDSIVKPNFVTISNPIASFSINDSTASCPPLAVQANNSSLNYTSVLWDFGDGNSSVLINPLHYYTQGGNFRLSLIVKGYGECYDSATKTISLRGPKGNFIFSPGSGCYPQLITFNARATNTSEFTWDFGDGSTLTTQDSKVSYTYTQPGLYFPKVIFKDSLGCKVPVLSMDTIKVNGAFPVYTPNATTGCDSSLVSFADSSIINILDPIRIWQWNFGDGSTSAEKNPSHYYKAPGTYNASVIITTDSGCKSTYTTPVTVNINKSPRLVASFADSACVSTAVNYAVVDTANTGQLQWSWNFGNSDFSDIQNPVYTHTTPGIYDVSVIGTATTGCADTVRKNINILAPPPVNAGNDTITCLNSSITLHPSGASTYQWAFSPSLSCTSCTSPVATPDITTTYAVTGMDLFGCSAMDSVKVEVVQPTQLSVAIANDTLCLGNSVQLNVTGAQNYTWLPPDGLSNPTIGNPVASPSSSTVYTVIGYDNQRCFSDTEHISIVVAPNPTFDIVDSVVAINVGTTYKIQTTSSPTVIGWSWIPASGLSCSNCAEPFAQPKSNVTYSAQAVTAFGCTASDNIRFEVSCNNANVFIPNTFSPNNDGKNDYFFPQGKGLFNIKSMKIFNRWGILVFAKTNFAANVASNGWNGKYNSAEQQADVYVYVIDVTCENGTVLSYKGNVTLLR